MRDIGSSSAGPASCFYAIAFVAAKRLAQLLRTPLLTFATEIEAGSRQRLARAAGFDGPVIVIVRGVIGPHGVSDADLTIGWVRDSSSMVRARPARGDALIGMLLRRGGMWTSGRPA